ncbi:Ficolin-1 [Holothuria leucospilota]|uniref:Ficolin-1 n=1 Tax=Holothuria leucospilota TaxID=206669 RepID=A0A9Q0YCF8_HOLLE|nr:Ficolin-1 [Holothuria leucospilota]
MTLSNGSSFYVKYNYFRISDEWNDYAIVSVGEFRSNWTCVVSTCPLTMNRNTCTCQDVCNDPIGQTDCYTECVETCVPEGCSVPETNSLITNGESFINANCSQNCTCIDNQLNCNIHYQCSPYATCSTRDEIRKCYCNEGYEGNGETCISVFKDCYEAYQAGHTTDGIYTILPTDWPGSPFRVFCNMTFGDGGWTVFQRRIDGVTDFFRNWTEYKQGFGLLNEGNDFWLGNEQLHYLTDQKNYILRVDFVHSSDRLYYNEFTTFKIGDESTKYLMSYSSFKSGNTGYTYTFSYNNGKQFSTRDQDNDECSNHHFADRHRGGWWYSDNWCTGCYGSHCHHFQYGSSGCYTLGTYTNLNGDYNGGSAENIFYNTNGSNDCNHKFAEMKIRPSN